jgi:drug/metabolite transporter (DMT)-like permease
MDSRIRGMLLVGGAALTWSTGGLLARLVEATDSWTVIFWRCGSASVFLLACVAIREGRRTPRVFGEMGWPGVSVGICMAVASISLVVALSYTSVAQALVIMSSTPLIAAIFGRVFLGEAIRPATAVTIAVVMAGIAIMVSGSEAGGSLLGDFFAALIAISYAAAIVISRRYEGTRMMPAACLGTAMATIFALLFATPLAVTVNALPLLFLFGAGQLGLGLALFVTGVRLIPASHSALLAMLEPILGPVWVWLVLSERPATTVLVGGTIVIASIIVKTVADIRHDRATAAAPAAPEAA